MSYKAAMTQRATSTFTFDFYGGRVFGLEVNSLLFVLLAPELLSSIYRTIEIEPKLTGPSDRRKKPYTVPKLAWLEKVVYICKNIKLQLF